MRMQTLLAAAVGIAVLGVALPSQAVEFEPFTESENVCPDCEKEESDTVTLSDGTEIRCNIVAMNSDFLVVERYGEVRGVPKSRLKSHSFAGGNRPSDLESQDQIVLQNGHVLTGRVVDESSVPGHFELKSSVGDVSFVIFKSQVQALYRSGEKEEVETPDG